MATIKIALDAGHGLKTPGKQTPDGIKEWTLNDKVRDKVVKILSAYDCEIIHTDNNEGKTDESLASRLAKYKSAGVKAFVSIHHNALSSNWSKATGVEVFTDKNPTAKDKKLAKCVYDRLVKYTGLKGRGIKQENFWVINQNTIPAILCEGGFMDGTNDYKVITSDEGQTAYAKAVAEGLIEFLNLKKKKVKTEKSESKYYKKYTGDSIQIDTVFKAVGVPAKYCGSWSKRVPVAKANGIKDYEGSAKQNEKLIALAKKGKLKK